MAEFNEQNYFTLDMAGTATSNPEARFLYGEPPYEGRELIEYENGISNYERRSESDLHLLSDALMMSDGGLLFQPWTAPFRNATDALVILRFSIEELDGKTQEDALPIIGELETVLESARKPQLEQFASQLQEAIDCERGRRELWAKLGEAGGAEKVDDFYVRHRVARLLGFQHGSTEEGERVCPILEGPGGEHGVWLGRSSLYLSKFQAS